MSREPNDEKHLNRKLYANDNAVCVSVDVGACARIGCVCVHYMLLRSDFLQ